MGTVFQAVDASGASAWVAEYVNVAASRSLGFATHALALSDEAIYLHDERLRACDKFVLVLGNHMTACASTIANCDYTVKIPIHHEVDSERCGCRQRRGFLGSSATKWRIGKRRLPANPTRRSLPGARCFR